MPFDKFFKEQVDLLITVLGYMDWDKCFALKGGTALNLFYADMPRLSVDIDLVYLPLNSRGEAITEITEELKRHKEKFSRQGLEVQISNASEDDVIEKLVVSRGQASIKIEPNSVMRGAFNPLKSKLSSKKVNEYFQQEVEVTCLGYSELMAGKLVAILDRQHPRDIFDMMHF